MPLYKKIALSLLSLLVTVLTLSCAKEVKPNSPEPDTTATSPRLSEERSQAPEPPAKPRVTRGFGKTSVSSVTPPELLLIAGKSLIAEIKGSGLDAVQGTRALRGRSEEKEIRGSVSCSRGESCKLELSASQNVKAANYQLALLDKNSNILTYVPANLIVKADTSSSAVAVSSIDPSKLVAMTGKSIDAVIRGKGLRVVHGIQAQFKGKEITDIQGKIECGSDTECKLSLGIARGAQAEQYQLALLDKNQHVLTYLSVPLIVQTLTGNPDGDEPDGILPGPGQQDYSVSRLCVGTPDSTYMTLILPPANGALTVDTEVQWNRTEIDTCTATGGDYRLYFCRSEVDCRNADPNYVLLTPGWNSNILDNGRADISGFYDAIGTGLSVSEGEVIYLQMRFESAGGQIGAPTVPRPLIHGGQPCSGNCPPELWTPNAATRIHATNKNFYWSDEGTAASWDICLKAVPGTAGILCNQQIRTTDNALTGLSYYEFDAWGLAGTEMEWKVRACTTPTGNQCESYSVPRSAKVPFAAPEIIQPAYRAETNLPLTATWQPVPGAEWYRLIVSHTTTQPEHHVDWILREPINTTSYTLTVDDFQDPPGALPGMLERFFSDSFSSLRVDACYEASDGHQICSDTYFGFVNDGGYFQGSNLVKFTDNPQANFSALIAAFRSPSCVNCHAVAATQFVSGGDGTYGLPPNHPGINAGTNCTGCHASTLSAVTPLSTHPDIAWQAAPSEMDFRTDDGQLKSDAELCNMARAGGEEITDPVEHLTEDPLILWAVMGGPKPLNSGNAPPAFGQGGVDIIPDWKQLIYDWAEAGMPCPSQ